MPFIILFSKVIATFSFFCVKKYINITSTVVVTTTPQQRFLQFIISSFIYLSIYL
jgi:hypothetical protein